MRETMKDRRTVSVTYEILRWLTEIIVPVFCAAYVSRVLGVSRLGLFSRSLAAVSYFTIPVAVCVREYGTRECIRYSDDREMLEAAASRILLIQMGTGAVMAAGWAALLCRPGYAETVFLIQGLRIIAAMSDVSWLLKGLEAFGKLARIRIGVRLAALSLTFLLVRPGRHPLETYALVQAGSLAAASLLQALVLARYRFRFRFRPAGLFRDLGPLFFLAVPSLALQVFGLMDRTMLGMMCDLRELGLYSAADRYVHIPMALVSSLFTIMMPRAFRLRDQEEKLSFYLARTLEAVLFPAVILGGVLAGCAGPFFRVFYGEEYALCGRLALYLLPAVFLAAAGEWYRRLCLIPLGRCRQDILSVVCGIAVNLAVNLRLIPRCGAAGAAFGSAAAGVIMLAVQRADPKALRIRIRPAMAGRVLCVLFLYAGMDRFIAALCPGDLCSLVLRLAGGGLLGLFCIFCLLDRYVLEVLLDIGPEGADEDES